LHCTGFKKIFEEKQGKSLCTVTRMDKNQEPRGLLQDNIANKDVNVELT
jgi:hypothetical protein